MPRWIPLAAALVLGATAAPVTTPSPAGAATRYLDVMFEVDVLREVVYGHAPAPDGSGALVELRLDLYTPRGDTATERPAFLYAHGGAFLFGNKRDSDPVGWATRMAQRGYVAMSIGYRLGPALVLPPLDESERAQIDRARHDMQTAVQWVRANSEVLRVDPGRIGVGGSSAGAITALGLALNSDSADAVPFAAVCGAVSISGANDPSAASADDAGAIFFHGTQDDLVPYALASATRDAMVAAGLPVQFHSYAEGHVDQFSTATRDDVRAKTVQWLYERVATAPQPCSPAVARRQQLPESSRTVLRAQNGRSAVVSIVAVDTLGPGYVQALPCADTPGATANVNSDGPNQIRGSLAIVQFDASGTACLYNQVRTHLVADLQGYLIDRAIDDVPDARLLDTRAGVIPRDRSTIELRGRPSATAIASVVVTETTGAGYVQVLPCGATPGAYATANSDGPGQTRSGLAFVTFDTSGRACIHVQTSTHVVVDVQAYLQPGTFDVVDTRVLDTRLGAKPGAGTQTTITGRPDATAVLSIVATETDGPGYVQVLPCGTTPGATANVNADARGQTVGRLAFVHFDSTGRVCLYNQTGTHLVVDVQGYLTVFEDVPDVRLLDTRVE